MAKTKPGRSEGGVKSALPAFCITQGCDVRPVAARMPAIRRSVMGPKVLPGAHSRAPSSPLGILVVGAKTGMPAVVEQVVAAVPREFCLCGRAADSRMALRLLGVAKPSIAFIELALRDGCGI